MSANIPFAKAMTEDATTFLAFRYADGTWTAMQRERNAKLIELIETLELLHGRQSADWADLFY